MALTQGQIVLYSLLKHSGVQKPECIAILSLLDDDELMFVHEQIAELMDNNGWILPTEQELMEILWPILKAKD